jgi:hypothetical protein
MEGKDTVRAQKTAVNKYEVTLDPGWWHCEANHDQVGRELNTNEEAEHAELRSESR